MADNDPETYYRALDRYVEGKAKEKERQDKEIIEEAKRMRGHSEAEQEDGGANKKMRRRVEVEEIGGKKEETTRTAVGGI